ncbi:MAG TPA: transcriptional regulator [candidate division Zixibacteria bacterium]|nr:transcriptional regulator [candidate division Zixibacteria bacterium]
MVKESVLTMEPMKDRPLKNRTLRIAKNFPASPAESPDRLLQERIRLGIISTLAVNPSLSFNDLKNLLKTSDGNLSVHARRLEEAGLVKCIKSFAGRIPKTEYKITEAGRKALERHLDEMEKLIAAMRSR